MNLDGPEAPCIQILLATYNGAAFLREQLNSLLNQTYGNFEILVRDDGSTDDTLALLQSYQDRYSGFIRILTNNETGRSAKSNYLSLIKACAAPYVAFCDQDDVWQYDKLKRSMTAMLSLEKKYGKGLPALIFTDLEVVNQNGEELFASLWAQQHINPSRMKLKHLLLQNTVTGCTALLNRALVMRCTTMPSEAVMHDWWVALMISIYGHAEGLEARTVRYRQHGANAVGAVLKSSSRWVPKWHAHSERQADWDACVQQARGLLASVGGDLNAEQRKALQKFLLADTSTSRLGRVGAFLAGGLRRTEVRSTLALLWYLWNKDASRASSQLEQN